MSRASASSTWPTLLHRSSIMPQKKKPDVPELVRARPAGSTPSGRPADLMKGSAGYNKDNQEDKEPLLRHVDTLTDTLTIYADMLTASPSNPTRCALRSCRLRTATDLADYLVKKGVPFRDAP